MYEHFVVYTDHGALHWFLTIHDPRGRLSRWRLRLAEFDFEVKYKMGKINAQADELSQLHTTGETVPLDTIQLFELSLVRVELGHNCNPIEVHFIDAGFRHDGRTLLSRGRPAAHQLQGRGDRHRKRITIPTQRSLLRRDSP